MEIDKENVFSEEEQAEVFRIVHSELHNSLYDYVFHVFLLILLFIGFIAYLSFSKHNSEVDYHNKQLQFCKDIYYSDNVILEQCKDYFVIVEKGIENNENG